MRSLGLFIVVMLLTGETPLFANPSVRWGLRLEGESRQAETAERGDLLGASLLFGFHVPLTDELSVSINPAVKFRSGHEQAATATNSRAGTLLLREARVAWENRQGHGVSAGVLDLTRDHSSLLVEEPMAAAGLRLGATVFDGFVYAGVPGSATSNSNSDQADKTPTFFSTGVRMKTGSENFKTLFQISLFRYQNLPTSVSNDSTLLGNSSIAGPGGQLSAVRLFKYEFSGYEGLLRLDWRPFTTLELKTEIAGILNREAPEEFNAGYRLSQEGEVFYSAHWSLIPFLTYYRVEPDATVANFNDARLTTNRQGYLAGLRFKHRDNFQVGGLFGERDAIHDRGPLQSRETYVGLILEATDVAF